ncbi:MAG: alanine racemase [Verrucomicrobia bacterium]|nr:alanine racemase [Verrucomicrobiota bacterium]
MTKVDRSWVEIDMAALRHNLQVLRNRAAPGVRVAAVIKADAYGHGLATVARALDADADLFAVANVTEARSARTAGATKPILVLGPALPDERAALVEGGFIPSISTVEEAKAYAALVPAGSRLSVHLVIDTGMGRIGLWGDEVTPVFDAIRRASSLDLTAVSSHLPVADDDPAYTEDQIVRFNRELARRLGAVGSPATILNSAGVLRFGSRAANHDIIRAGLAMYGISPVPEWQNRLIPALTWKTRVSLVRLVGPGRSISYGRTFITPRETLVGTLAVGYGDGYRRHLSGNHADVLVRGVRCPLLGRVTMDQIMVDLTGAGPVVLPGDEAVLIGRQGREEILASELAAKAGTIAWEIFTGIGSRVVRRHGGSTD